jgi:hypothetical protein
MRLHYTRGAVRVERIHDRVGPARWRLGAWNELTLWAINEKVHHFEHDLAEKWLSTCGSDEAASFGASATHGDPNDTRHVHLCVATVGVLDICSLNGLKPKCFDEVLG